MQCGRPCHPYIMSTDLMCMAMHCNSPAVALEIMSMFPESMK